MGHELRFIANLRVCMRWVQLQQVPQRVEYVNGLAAPADRNARQMRLHFQHLHQFQRPAIHRPIELVFDRPNVPRVFLAQQFPRSVVRTRALLPARKGPLEPFLTSDPLQPLLIVAPALKPQLAVDQPPVPAHMAAGHFTDAPAQFLLLNRCHRHGLALRVAVLACHNAGTSLGNSESILHNH